MHAGRGGLVLPVCNLVVFSTFFCALCAVLSCLFVVFFACNFDLNLITYIGCDHYFFLVHRTVSPKKLVAESRGKTKISESVRIIGEQKDNNESN